MADGFSFGGALSGGLAGFGAGAGVGSIIPGFGTLAGGIIGGLAGFAGGGFSGGGQEQAPPDISEELARLRALFAEQRRLAAEDISQQLGTLQSRTASSLAGRGVLRSAVSEASFTRNREAAQRALGLATGQIGGREAQTIASLIGQTRGQEFKFKLAQQEQRRRSRGELLGALAGFGTAALSGQFGKPTRQPRGAGQISPFTFGGPRRLDLPPRSRSFSSFR